MTEITKSSVLNAIKKIEDKDFNKNSLSLNSITKLEQENDALNIDISIPALKQKSNFDYNIIADTIKKEFPTVKEIHLNVQQQVSKVSTHNDPKKEAILPGVKNTIAVVDVAKDKKNAYEKLPLLEQKAMKYKKNQNIDAFPLVILDKGFNKTVELLKKLEPSFYAFELLI